MKNKLFGGLLVAMGCAMGLQPAAAATVSFFGTGTALGARADFTTSAGLLAVTVTNTLAPNQIISAAQAVSDIIFTLSNAPGTLGATTATGQFATCQWDGHADDRGWEVRPGGWGQVAKVSSASWVTPSRWRLSVAVSQVR